MAFWFGRKSALPERRPCVPAWLQSEGVEAGGFARGIEGARALDRISGQMVERRGGNWEAGVIRAQELRVNGQTVVRDRQGAIGDPAGGAVADAECRSAVSSILGALRAHGLIG